MSKKKRSKHSREKNIGSKNVNANTKPLTTVLNNKIDLSKDQGEFKEKVYNELVAHIPFVLGFLFTLGKAKIIPDGSSVMGLHVLVLLFLGLTFERIWARRVLILTYLLSFFVLNPEAPSMLIMAVSLLVLSCLFRVALAYSLGSILFKVINQIAFGSLLSVFGVYAGSEMLVWQAAFIGMVPSAILASTTVLKHIKTLEQLGFTYSSSKTNSAGKTIRRPGAITKLYTIPLIFGIGLPLAVVPLKLVPTTFLLQVITIYFAFKLSEACFEERDTVLVIKRRTESLAWLAALLMAIAGLV
jgi:hypothetical protein